MSTPLLLWMRAETRSTERRAPLVPSDVMSLVAEGVDVVVERSDRRAVPDARYAAAGARLADPGAWVLDAPDSAFVLGLKELPAEPVGLRHRHIFFGHAYKRQPGADVLLTRFADGGGELLDLEYLCDAAGRRLTAFGTWAGYVGASLAVLHWGKRLTAPLQPGTREELDRSVRAAAAGPKPRVLVLGANGRSGRGACAALAQAGIPTTGWDVAETQQLNRDALLGHDIVVNAVLTAAPIRPFLTTDDLRSNSRRLTVLSDVSCDVGSPCNAFPLYDTTTTWDAPVHRMPGDPELDIIAIDNLPSLLPHEASVSFSAALRPHITALNETDGVWATCRTAFERSRANTFLEEPVHA